MKPNANQDEMSKKKRVAGFQVLEESCIWMKAGIVNFRICDNAYDCYNCPFDKGMQRAMGSGENVGVKKEKHGWTEYFKANHPGSERPCRYALTGRIDAPKICPMNYECYHCAFDQMMDNLDFARIGDVPQYALASGYKMADGYYYHAGHCWVRFEHGGRVRVGFDDFMARLFGRLQSLTLPPLGSELKKDKEGITFGRENYKATSVSPVTGTVLAINQNVREHPEMAHEDPFYKGWLYILEPNTPKRNLKGLYFGKESIQWMEQEGRKLLNLIGPEYEQLAATGAEPIRDVFGSFPELEWDQLVKTFLQPRR